MSSIRDKAGEHIFWEEQQPIRKINNTLTTIQAKNILNRLILNYNISDNDLKEIEVLKSWLGSK